MIRDHALGFAAVATALVSLGGALAIARAQQEPAAAPPRNEPAARGADAAPKAATQPAAGANFRGQDNGRGGTAPVGFPPGMSQRGVSGAGMMGPPMGMGVDDDPEMAELAQAEAVLANESEELVGRFAETDNAADRKLLAGDLRQTLAKQFDVQRKRRELELSRIEERVRKLRDQIKKRDDARETIIDRRLDQLVNEVEGLGWTPPAGAKGAARSPYAPGRNNFGNTSNRGSAAK